MNIILKYHKESRYLNKMSKQMINSRRIQHIQYLRN
jgi:hypothetical protein